MDNTPIAAGTPLTAQPQSQPFSRGEGLARGSAVIISLILLTSTFGHSQNPPAFYETLLKYDLFSWQVAFFIAWVIPWFQILLALALLCFQNRQGFLFALLLFLGFVTAQSLALFRGVAADCGCLGPLYPSPLGWRSLLIPILGTFCSLLGWFFTGRTLPMSTLANETAIDVQKAHPIQRPAVTLIELLVVLAVIGILFGLVLGAVQKTRERARQLGCQNNLKQLALAAESFQTQHGCYPAGCSVETDNRRYPHQSWITTLLPWIGRDDLARQASEAFGKNSFYYSTPHNLVRATLLPQVICPSNPSAETPLKDAQWYINDQVIGPFDFALTSYLGVGGKNYKSGDGILYIDSQVRSTDIQDGKSNTLLIGERPPGYKKHFGWWYAAWGIQLTGAADFWKGVEEIPLSDSRFDSCAKTPQPYRAQKEDNPCAPFQFWSLHSGGAFFAYADGSVRFLNYGSGNLLTALATRSGSEMVSDP